MHSAVVEESKVSSSNNEIRRSVPEEAKGKGVYRRVPAFLRVDAPPMQRQRQQVLASTTEVMRSTNRHRGASPILASSNQAGAQN